MKAGWESQKLGDIAHCSLGKMLDKKKNRGTLQPYLRNVNVRWFDFDLSDMLHMPFGDGEHDRYLIRKGDLVICEGGYPGRCAIWQCDQPVFFQKALHRARFHDPETAKWIQYFLWMKDADGSLREHFTGAGIQHFTGQALARLTVPLPPLEEQRRIVAVLDKAFAGIATATANAQKNLTNARALFASALASVFTKRGEDWIEEPIAKSVRFIDYRGKTPPKRDTGIRLITAKNVKMGYVRRTPEEFIDAAAYDEWMTRGFPQRGDVLFTTEAPLGNVAQMDTDEKVVIGQRLITMQAMPQKIENTFLKYMLCSAPLQEAIHAHATGATVLGIKAKLLKTIPIFYPKTIKEQLQIVARLDRLYDQVEAQARISEAKLAALTELKQSLLQKAFAGELT